ncbi:hypothetical protein J6590_086572 [Homalodisca vitripennis]|nr:hypothetical protein J6590_086572 [Homalodisca vitripennis]
MNNNCRPLSRRWRSHCLRVAVVGLCRSCIRTGRHTGDCGVAAGSCDSIGRHCDSAVATLRDCKVDDSDSTEDGGDTLGEGSEVSLCILAWLICIKTVSFPLRRWDIYACRAS